MDIIWELWGKMTFDNSRITKSLMTHMLETGLTAKVLMEEGICKPLLHVLMKYSNMEEERLIQCISFICALHDIGKIHPVIQQKSMELAPLLEAEELCFKTSIEHFRHEMYGEGIIDKLLEEDSVDEELNIPLIRKVIRIHHQKSYGNNIVLDKKREEKWWTIQKKVYRYLKNAFKIDNLSVINNEDYFFVISQGISGILITSDWIASNEDVYDTKEITDFSDVNDFFEYKKNFLLSFMEKEGMKFHPFPECRPFENVIPYVKRDMMNPMQQKVEQVVGNCLKTGSRVSLMIIESGCGTGKTEAALYAASVMGQGKCGVYMGFPTSVSAEAAQERVSTFLSGLGMALPKVFSSKSCFKDSEDEWHFTDYSRQRMLYPSAVGTIDQVLTVARRVKYESVRCAGLTSKVLILDEIHAYDAYMMEIIKLLLQLCRIYEIPVIMLSATLPEKMKLEYIREYTNNRNLSVNFVKGYPLVTYIDTDMNVKSEPVIMNVPETKLHYSLERMLGDPVSIAELAICKVEYGGCLCIILNTVNDAIQVYDQIKSKLLEQKKTFSLLKDIPSDESDIEIILYHARKPDYYRNKDSEIILKRFGKKDKEHLRPKCAIVVGTQTLEQSIDVDFDFLITSICPIDMFVQRAGRRQRHDDNHTIRTIIDLSQDRIHVLVPDKETGYEDVPDRFVYEKCFLEQTENILTDYMERGLKVPFDIPEVVNAVYENIDAETAFKDNRKMSESARGNLYSLNSRDENREFQIYEFVEHKEADNKYIVTRNEDYRTVKIAILPEDSIDAIRNNTNIDYKELYEKYAVNIPETKNRKYEEKAISIHGTDKSKKNKHKGFFDGVFIYQEGDCFCQDTELAISEEYGVVERPVVT